MNIFMKKVFLIITIVFIASCSQYVAGRVFHPLGFLPIIDYQGDIYALFKPTTHTSNKESVFFKKNTELTNTIAKLDKNNYKWSIIGKIYDTNISSLSKDYNLSILRNLRDEFNYKFNYRFNTSYQYFPNFDFISNQYTLKGRVLNKNSYIIYINGKIYIKEISSNKILFEDNLPTNDEIINNINITIINGYNIEYMPFLTKQFEWDRKKHIISIATDKKKIDTGEIEYKVYYAYLYRDNSNQWNYQLIDDKYSYLYKKYNVMKDTIIPHHSLDGKANLCFKSYYFANDDNGNSLNKERCFVLENGKVYFKDLFGDIYNIEYKNMLDSIYKDVIAKQYNYTFDKNGNMHLFYNKREDIVNNNYDYFWYGYFIKDNPTTPQNEQKIYWR